MNIINFILHNQNNKEKPSRFDLSYGFFTIWLYNKKLSSYNEIEPNEFTCYYIFSCYECL